MVPTLGGPRETSGPRIDRTPSTRPPWWNVSIAYRSPQPPGGVNSNNDGSDPTPMHEATKENLLALIAESDDDEDAWAADLEEELFS